MSGRKRRSCFTTILIMMTGFILTIGLVIGAIFIVQFKKQSDKKAEIPYQKITLKDEDFVKKYYYESLEEQDKIVYQEILQGLFDGVKEIYLHSSDGEKTNQLFQFVLNDYPEIFWCDGRGQTTIFETKEEVYSVLTPEYQYEESERKIREQEIEQIVENVIQESPVNGTEYEKIKYVYEYVVRRTEYNDKADDNQNIYSVLVNGESVCAGYARTMQYLLERLNIFCTYVTGKAKRSETDGEIPHAWNLVSCNGNYYYVDSTWGDPVYLEDSEQTIVYDYLCIAEDELFKTHVPDNVVDFPECKSLEYNYYVLNDMYYFEYDRNVVLGKMKESIEQKQEEVIFKFANDAVYGEAKEGILNELVQEAAEYLGKMYQLSEVEYFYKDEAALNKITISWKYGGRFQT